MMHWFVAAALNFGIVLTTLASSLVWSAFEKFLASIIIREVLSFQEDIGEIELFSKLLRRSVFGFILRVSVECSVSAISS